MRGLDDRIYNEYLLSNQTKLDTYLEARKNRFAGNLGGYSTDSANAVNILVGNELLKKKGRNPPKSATNDSDISDRDYSDDDDSDYADSDYSDNSDGDSNADVEDTDAEESIGTVEATDDEISIGTSGVEEAVGNPGVDTDGGTCRSSGYRREPERFEEDASYYEARANYYKAKENKESVTSKTNMMARK